MSVVGHIVSAIAMIPNIFIVNQTVFIVKRFKQIFIFVSLTFNYCFISFN